MSQHAFQQVDVFTTVAFKGNPVAVVFNGDSLSTEQMLAIANWTNLSENTFVCSSAHAVLRHGLTPRTPGRLVQECGKGLVQLQIDGERLFLSVPVPAFSDPPSGLLP